MNKTILVLAVLAFCLPANVFSAENENRELAGIKLGNLGSAIGGLIGAIKNNTSNAPTTNNTSTVPVTNNTSTAPVSNTNSSTNNTNTTPVTNNTSSTPTANNTASNPTNINTTYPPVTNNTSTAPVTNNTSTIPANNNTSTAPVTNNTSTTPVTNNTSTAPVVNNTQPVAESDDSDDSDDETTNSTTPATPATPVKYARNDVNMATFKDDCMKVHNQVRMDVGLNNLTWSDSLAASAQIWAENMAKNGFRHSGKTGENIASSSYSTKTFSRLIGMWTKEKNYYIVGCKYPKCSSTGQEVGHYTQMVWWSTTQVGCGFAPGYNRGYNYLCCQYYKAGNIVGQTVYPVKTA